MGARQNKILVICDQKTVSFLLHKLLQSEGFNVITTSSIEAFSLFSGEKPDAVVMDVQMMEIDWLEVLKKIKEMDPQIPVIVIVGVRTAEITIEAMKSGAYECLMKPFEKDELINCIKSAIKERQILDSIVLVDEMDEPYSEEKIIGRSRKMLEIYKIIGLVAKTDAPVLITGESGTGKELIAKAIHAHSKRVDKPFLAINCAAIPEQLLEAELFGYEKGAFTGADTKRMGKFEHYTGGTIFLDEIGDLSLNLQAKLLRVLQDGTFLRLGGTKPIKTDVRIIAATNKNLDEMLKKGTFREDLYYRLSAVRIDVPPLRERKEDIKDLCLYFIKKFNKILGKNIKGITKDAINKLQEYSWPGNVRELENVIQKAVLFCKGDYLSVECFEQLKPKPLNPCSSIEEAIRNLADTVFKTGCYDKFQEIINKIEVSMVRRALELTKGNQVKASKLLGISRNTLRKKLREGSKNGKTINKG